MKKTTKMILASLFVAPLALVAIGCEEVRAVKVETFEEFSMAVSGVESGERIKLTKNLTSNIDGEDGIVKISGKDIEIDFGNYTYTLDLPNATGSTDNWVGLRVTDGANVTLNGTIGGITTADNGELYAILVGTRDTGADLTIKGGKYYGGESAVQVTKGTLTIEGGFFESALDNPTYLINCIDEYYNDDTANIIIKGGTFVNFNPADNEAEQGDHINFVAEGYTVETETQGNGDVWYIVQEAQAS